MKRGFPRPQMYIEVCTTNVIVDDEGVRTYGGYGEKWNHKTYPVPYTAQSHNISTVESDRLDECHENCLCLACGEQVPQDEIWAMVMRGEYFQESGPFHEKCARLTERMCPHIAESKGKYTFKQATWDEVKSGFN